jgi:tRNA(fMet)-specific endonuclease VapC
VPRPIGLWLDCSTTCRALPFGEAQAHRYGLLAAAVKDRRRDALDRLIAAHALSLDLTLVTNNEADFAGYPGLRVENWLTGP